MALARVRSPNLPEKDSNSKDSLENLFTQKTTKDPFLSLSKTGDTSLQWIQLLHALDQQGKLESDNKKQEDQQPLLELNNEKYLPGWPLLSPPTKVQMQKCEKCSMEFCSTINYRRHIRMHRRSPIIDKDFAKNREHIGAFWDKLSLEEASEIVSLSDISIEGTSGTTITKYLLMWNRKPNYVSLPYTYIKAGNNLLDIVLQKQGTIPIPSKELFNIFDDVSEKTFMCAGNAMLIQKFLFDGDAEKIILEMKNLAACLSLLFEQKLVKAWLDNKAAEALRCQKLLVEEEEAAQKRQAELTEKKRQKKLRQKEKLNLKENKTISPEIPSPKSQSSDSSEPNNNNNNNHNNNSVLEIVNCHVNKENCSGDNNGMEVLIGSISVAVENASYNEIRKEGIIDNTNTNNNNNNNNKGIAETNEISEDTSSEINEISEGIPNGIIEISEDISNEITEDISFSKEAADFLARRWREALESDHVMLVLSPEKDSTNNMKQIPKSRPKPGNNCKLKLT